MTAKEKAAFDLLEWRLEQTNAYLKQLYDAVADLRARVYEMERRRQRAA
jgi:hypothetical protein